MYIIYTPPPCFAELIRRLCREIVTRGRGYSNRVEGKQSTSSRLSAENVKSRVAGRLHSRNILHLLNIRRHNCVFLTSLILPSLAPSLIRTVTFYLNPAWNFHFCVLSAPHDRLSSPPAKDARKEGGWKNRDLARSMRDSKKKKKKEGSRRTGEGEDPVKTRLTQVAEQLL